MTPSRPNDADLWLGLFADVEPVWSQGWRGLFSARTAEGEPRLVLTAPPGLDVEEGRRWLDSVAETYARLDSPGLPKTVLRDAVGDIELVAFDCDAVGDLSYVAAQPECRIPYPVFYAVGRQVVEPLRALHATLDPATGRGHLVGRWSLCNVLYGPSGRLWLFNYGLADSPALTGTNVDAVTALSVAAGAPPRVHDDLQALVDAMFKTIVKLDAIPPRLSSLLAYQSGDEDARVVALFTQGMARIRGAGKPFESIDELSRMHAEVTDALGISYDPHAIADLVASLAAHRRRGDQTATYTPGGGPEPPAAEPPTSWKLGRYEIVSKLGSGGMGTAFLARDRQLQQRVVLKVMRERDEVSLARFIREIRIIRQLGHHPNIVTGYDLITEAGHTAAVMELIPGPTLRRWAKLRADAPDFVAQALGYGAQIADALTAVHAAGIVHRDIKPANILIAAERGAVLVDFGVADVDGAAALTATGVAIGTLRYMAPEQTQGRCSSATDVFALGRVLAELLDARELAPEVAAVIAQAQRARPEERPSAAELARRLRGQG